MAAQKQDDQLERTFSSYVRIQAVVLKTYLGRWTIGRSGGRGSGISVLPARYDDDDESYITPRLNKHIKNIQFYFFLCSSLVYLLPIFWHFLLEFLCFRSFLLFIYNFIPPGISFSRLDIFSQGRIFILISFIFIGTIFGFDYERRCVVDLLIIFLLVEIFNQFQLL